MESGSVTHWIEQIKNGDESIAEERLCDRYLAHLTALAHRKLYDLPPQVRDDEDVALSALNSFFLRVRQGSFSQLHDRHDLWRLLTRIVVRKSIDQRRKVHAEKRGAKHICDVADFEQDAADAADKTLAPNVLAAFKEQLRRLMGALDGELCEVARRKLVGYSNAEIAELMGRTERTVERKLERIRHTWLKDSSLS